MQLSTLPCMLMLPTNDGYHQLPLYKLQQGSWMMPGSQAEQPLAVQVLATSIKTHEQSTV